MTKSSSNQSSYSASSIKVMEGLEAVRKRPGMYIGSTDSKGLHHLVYEVVDNSVDEALAGHCDSIIVTLCNDGSCSVVDNGRGIPTDIHPTEGVSAAEVVLTKLHAGGKFDKETYAFSGGLHGVGVSVVNALSKWLVVEIYQNDAVHTQTFYTGVPDKPLEKKGKTTKRGTMIHFMPDEDIFKYTTSFSFSILSKRFQEMAYLNKGLSITLIDERDDKKVEYKYDNGIISFVQQINEDQESLFQEIIYYKYVEKNFELECALQYNVGFNEQLISFVNTINTYEGGTHVSGFKSALTAVCNKKAKDFNIIKKDESGFSSEDVREGMVCILSVKIAEPQFEGQTKAKLGNFDIKGMVHSLIFAFLDQYFEEQPAIARKILAKAEMALKAREAAKRARELTRKKGISDFLLPGKLADCRVNGEGELFIVEGDSAGGTAKTARDRVTQAILPLRGKILNVEKATIEKILGNEEIKALIAAIGIGFGEEMIAVEQARYKKIIIMTDADVDGSHIRILLLTFFYRYLRPMVDNGSVYVAQPPLYKVKIGKHDRYLQNDNDLNDFIITWIERECEIVIDGKKLNTIEAANWLNSVRLYFHALNEVSKKSGIYLPALEEIEEFEQFNDKFDKKFDEYRDELCQLHDKKGMVEKWKNVTIYHRNKIVGSISIPSILELVAVMKEAAKPFMNIQRYKGLGEMNSEQLWETAMDPEKRRLLQITVDDAAKSDYWFSVLMGEEVQERKQFIEERAHFVRNLDI